MCASLSSRAKHVLERIGEQHLVGHAVRNSSPLLKGCRDIGRIVPLPNAFEPKGIDHPDGAETHLSHE